MNRLEPSDQAGEACLAFLRALPDEAWGADTALAARPKRSQAELQKTEADIADTDAKYQYRLTEIVLAYTISALK
jgi:hypothetical protein